MNTRKELQPWRFFGITAAVFSLWLSKLAWFCSWEGVFGILLGTAVLCILHRAGLRAKLSGKGAEVTPEGVKRMLAFVRLLWYMAVFLVMTGSSAVFVRDCFWNGMSIKMSILILLLLFLPAVGKAHGAWQRVTAVSFPWLCLFVVGMPVLAVRQVQTVYMQSLHTIQPEKILVAAGIYLAASWYLLLIPGTGKKGMWPDSKEALYLLQGIFLAALCLLLQAVYGTEGAAYRRWPMLSLLQGISVPGKFLDRVDALWAAAVLFAVCLAAGLLLERMAACLVCLGVHRKSVRLWRWKDLIAFVLLAVCLLWYRYSGVEVQDRAFVGCVVADWEENGYVFWFPLQEQGEVTKVAAASFTEARESFAASQNRQPDFGHIEATVLGSHLLEQTEMTRRLFDELALWQEMDENSYVFQTEDPEAMFKADTKDTATGNYLSELYENRFGPAKDYLTLQQLLVAWEHADEITALPEVINKNETLWISEG